MKQLLLSILLFFCTLPLSAQNKELNARLGNTGQITVTSSGAEMIGATEFLASESSIP